MWYLGKGLVAKYAIYSVCLYSLFFTGRALAFVVVGVLSWHLVASVAYT
jgi:hypothetical protein